jgi:hypothetical protein
MTTKKKIPSEPVAFVPVSWGRESKSTKVVERSKENFAEAQICVKIAAGFINYGEVTAKNVGIITVIFIKYLLNIY